ncbi:hypothetical protein Isop_0821 [Isosphaera pallida ATCC 43644]|uniref:Uncharacterized protein n=1 Tax=Isosphaera pallida (strain ATCC 43644 / DSM 9630 / IS1B) TaxID=575540 RepID=E8R2C6_ISOPI|nr:hypothetical protein [Isosphaera pallida]ADV61411.1 hypothetical protein Isop_0821 [Isosphaera pallida ATCC 43644]
MDRPHSSPKRLATSIASVWLATWLAGWVSSWGAPQDQPPRPGQFRGVWKGQTGADYVRNGPGEVPNEIQDICIHVQGLPVNRVITRLEIRGFGGDLWVFGGPESDWKVKIVRARHATTAELYFEPLRVETGREFTLDFQFDDGQTARLIVRGGKADPNLRVPGKELVARWVGTVDLDRAGAWYGVGPDGLLDAAIDLERLSALRAVRALRLERATSSPSKTTTPSWAFGVGPDLHDCWHADFQVGTDPTTGRFLFQPDAVLADQPLILTVSYTDGSRQVVRLQGGPCRIDAPAAPPTPPVVSAWDTQPRWLEPGPDGRCRVEVPNWPTPTPEMVVLTDGLKGSWVWKRSPQPSMTRRWMHADSESLPLDVHIHGSKAVLAFTPLRDECDANMTLRAVERSGASRVVFFDGGRCDPRAVGTRPASSRTTARPGDDLARLAARFGVIELAPGIYRLNAPLTLEKPVHIKGPADAILLFRQPPHSEPWTAAIRLHAGQTTLEGFTVRFDGPIRWNTAVPYGPAVVGSVDGTVPHHETYELHNLVFRRLTLTIPPPANPDAWTEAPNLMRLISARDGVIEANTLRGGPVVFSGGPWIITDNDFQGTPGQTFSTAVFSGKHVHDLVLARNRAVRAPGSGPVWRFLVLTQTGVRNRIEGNIVRGVRASADDPIPHPNAPEVILTESYRIHFEGKPRGWSRDGRLILLPDTPGGPPRTGSVVAILAGQQAGRWTRVAQVLDPTTILLAEPLGPVQEPILVTTGFVDTTIERNEVDSTGGWLSTNLVLAGNHFGLKVRDNRLVGGRESLFLTAYPTESPGPWGWTHAPVFDALVEGNQLEKALEGAVISVKQDANIRAAKGRVYLTATLKGNRITPPVVLPPGGERVGLTLGDPGSRDPNETRITLDESVLGPVIRSGSSGSPFSETQLRIHAASINGRISTRQRLRWVDAVGSATQVRRHAEDENATRKR